MNFRKFYEEKTQKMSVRCIFEVRMRNSWMVVSDDDQTRNLNCVVLSDHTSVLCGCVIC